MISANRHIAELKGTATRIIVDPPFLSEDCQTKGVVDPHHCQGISN